MFEGEEEIQGAEPTGEETPPVRTELPAEHEEQDPKPQASGKAPALKTQQTPDLNAEIKKLLASELEPFKRGVGQVSKLEKQLQDFIKSQSAKPQPTVYSQLQEDERKTTRELVKAAWEEEYGEDWKAWQDQKRERQVVQAVNRADQIVRSHLGDSWTKEIDSKMSEIYADLKKKAEGGDEDARAYIDEIWSTSSGPKALAEQARALVAVELGSKSAEANKLQDKRASRAATTLPGASGKTPPVNDLQRAMAIPDRKERLAALARLVPHESE